MTQEELNEILRLHKLWLIGHEDGVRANLERANLEGANLERANLEGANLERANLALAIGNMKNIKSIQLEIYSVTYTHNIMQIGCKQYLIKEWFNFSDDQIRRMASDALEWWNKWKDTIKNIIEMSPAEPTGYVR